MKINKKIIIPLLFVFLGVNFTNAHPFYVSICQVDYNKQDETLEISLKIFANDLLEALANEGETKIYLGEQNENPKTDTLIYNYVQKHLNLEVNNQLFHYNFLGKEMDKDVVWSYFEIENIGSLESLSVSCDLLVQEFESQNNIIQVNKNGIIKNLLLNKNKTSGMLEFTN